MSYIKEQLLNRLNCIFFFSIFSKGLIIVPIKSPTSDQYHYLLEKSLGSNILEVFKDISKYVSL